MTDRKYTWLNSPRLCLRVWWLSKSTTRWGQWLCWLAKSLRRLRPVKRYPDTPEPSHGAYAADGVDITFGGNCPVQGYGEVDGHPAYYRARGTGWSLELYAKGVDPEEDLDAQPIWEHYDDPYVWPDGGWVPASESRRNIEAAVAEWRKAGAA